MTSFVSNHCQLFIINNHCRTKKAPAPSGGGLFGSTTPAPATGGGGLFGSTPAAPAPSTSLFGAPTTAPPATTTQSTNIFGAQPQPQPQQPQYYQYNQNPQAAALHAHQTVTQHQETARIEELIYNLHSKYSSVASDPRNVVLASNNMPSSLCAFTAILYDPLAPEHRTTNSSTTTSMMGGGGVGGRGGGHLSAPKPPHISNQVWNEALARNPDPNELCPVPLIGATSLHSRLISQQEKAHALSSHATQLRSTLDFLSKTASQSSNAIQFHIQKQSELNHRLLELMRKIEIIRCMNQPIQDAESTSNYQLRVLYDEVNRMIRVLCDLEERGREQARLWRKRGATGGVGDGVNVGGVNNGVGVDNTSSSLEEEDKLALFHVLNDQRLGMERLGSIVTRDVRDVDILKEEMGKALDQGRGGGGSVGGVRQQQRGTTAIFGGR
jgi:nuclear pore complex protein Nup54